MMDAVSDRPRRWNHNLHYHRVILDAVPAGCRRSLDVGCGEVAAPAAPLASAVADAESLRDSSVFRNTSGGRPEGVARIDVHSRRQYGPPPWASPKTVAKHARLHPQGAHA
jgi:hypothetical protein